MKREKKILEHYTEHIIGILRERFSFPSQHAVNVSRKTATIYASKNKWGKPPKIKTLSQ
ncbi:MAG: hypothetical protein QXV17_14440 [Candidatus Micrarchaeaceae archaeon]